MTELARKIASDAEALGIKKGDAVLVHSSLRSLGGASPSDVIDGLREALGEEGTLMLPALSYMYCNPRNRIFDYYATPSNVGALPEFFRTSVSGVKRSLNPTHSCCAIGKKADFLTSGHILDDTPCGENSPFRRLYELDGKILFIGCGMCPNTSMHAVEELSNPDYLFGDTYEYSLTDSNGSVLSKPCRSHGFDGVIQRYDRLTCLLSGDEISAGKILSADCYLISSSAMWKKADEKYREDPHYFIDRIE